MKKEKAYIFWEENSFYRFLKVMRDPTYSFSLYLPESGKLLTGGFCDVWDRDVQFGRGFSIEDLDEKSINKLNKKASKEKLFSSRNKYISVGISSLEISNLFDSLEKAKFYENNFQKNLENFSEGLENKLFK